MTEHVVLLRSCGLLVSALVTLLPVACGGSPVITPPPAATPAARGGGPDAGAPPARLSAPSWVGASARLVTRKGSGNFFTEPFAIPARGGVRVVLHTYACSKQLDDALIAFQSAVLVEADGQGLKVTQAIRGFNFARIAWLPRISLALPGEATGLESSIESNSSLEVQKEGDHAVLLGTMGPGKHELEVSFHLPLHGDAAHFRLAMPPRVAQVRLLAAASAKTQLVVVGFPQAMAPQDGMIGTERRLQRGEAPLTEIDVDVRSVAPAPH